MDQKILAEFSSMRRSLSNDLRGTGQQYGSAKVIVTRDKDSWEVPAFKCVDPSGRTYFLFPPSANVAQQDSLEWGKGERWLVTSTNNLRHRILLEVSQLSPVPIKSAVGSTAISEDESDDLLTLFLRKKVFDRDLSAFVDTALRRSQPLGLLMADLDNFKAVNDEHGHSVGDEVLIDCSKIIAARIEGKGGRAYRLSGGADEFPILLPNFSVIECEAIAEVLRRSVEASTVSSKALRVTVSIGVAAVPDHAKDGDSLFRLADEALRQAKKLRRNLVRVSGEPEQTAQQERSIERRQPDPDELSDDQREALFRQYLKYGHVKCPRDGVPLRFIDATSHDSKTTEFLISCPHCGLQDRLPG